MKTVKLNHKNLEEAVFFFKKMEENIVSIVSIGNEIKSQLSGNNPYLAMLMAITNQNNTPQEKVENKVLLVVNLRNKSYIFESPFMELPKYISYDKRFIFTYPMKINDYQPQSSFETRKEYVEHIDSLEESMVKFIYIDDTTLIYCVDSTRDMRITSLVEFEDYNDVNILTEYNLQFLSEAMDNMDDNDIDY